MTTIKQSSSNQINKRIVSTKCPVAFALYRIGGRWKPLVINQLLTGKKRYSELKKAVPAVSEKMLIQTLKELEADAIIIRQAMPVVPPHVEYTLTDRGKDLSPVLKAMVKWGQKYNTG
jgi:DNA-binding HxlR family transcriptional regulator